MEYRLISIYKFAKGEFEEVDIEVNRELHKATLGPFIRNVGLEELAYSDLSSPEEIIFLLNQLGYTKQPLVLSEEVLSYPSVQKVLRENRWNYKKEGHGSVIKTAPYFPLPTKRELSLGHLLHGELYITDLVHWNKHIKVRLVYENAITSFFPVCNSLPCKASSGRLFIRNQQAEGDLMEDLVSYLDDNHLDISLSDLNIDFLKSLSDKGWKIYVERKGKSYEIHAHQNKSGIVWFDRNEHIEDDNRVIEQILEGYLHGRNYVEAGNKLGIFRSENITHQKNAELAADLVSDSADISKLYAENEPLTNFEKEEIEYRIGEGVDASLKPYQWEGVLWMATMRKNHKGCLLADEMGLGKTLQVLSHLYAIKDSKGSFLIIVPTSLIPNWQKEIDRFIPEWRNDITVQDRLLINPRKIILVSYDILRLNISVYRRYNYDTIVVDEAQVVKNRDTQKYQTIRQLTACHRIIMTGTPIENSINDIWSHMMFLNPSLQGVFRALTRDKIGIDSPEFIELSRKLLKPFVYRRTKEEVLQKLPGLEEEDIYIDLSSKERNIYNKVKGVFVKALQTGISGRLNSIALEGLLRLRQTCVSPNLLPPSLYRGDKFMSSKMYEVLSLIKLNISSEKKILVFSQFVGALKELEVYLQKRGVGYTSLYGDTLNRKARVDDFQNDPAIKVFLISLRAGGVGLNLTAATTVILLDDWWNPAVEEQAFSRAHRIGQHHDVTVYRLVCKDTVEEKILQLQDKKKKTIDVFNAAGNKLTAEELIGLLA